MHQLIQAGWMQKGVMLIVFQLITTVTLAQRMLLAPLLNQAFQSERNLATEALKLARGAAAKVGQDTGA